MAQFEFKITIGTDMHPEAVGGVVVSVLAQNGIEGFISMAGAEFEIRRLRAELAASREREARMRAPATK